MSNRRKRLCLAVVLLLLFVVLVCIVQSNTQHIAPFFVQLSTDGKCEMIRLWEQETGEYYVFLPSYADFSEAEIRLNTTVPIYIDGEILTEGMVCEIFQSDVVYDVTYTVWGKEYNHTIVFMKSADVATMYIDTESGSMEYIHDKKGNEEAGTISLYTPEGTLDYAGELLSINGRGNNTWDYFDKKAYSVKLSEEADLLDMGQAQKWILLANADDPSHLRNKIAYDFAKNVGLNYSPDCQWVDVYLNDEYAGLYLLSERNELHSERIDIGQTDSFVVSLEKLDRLAPQNYPHVITEERQALRVHYPVDPSNEMLENLAAIWQTVENTILAEDGIDVQSGKSWIELIDLESWTKKYLVEEIFANGDACFISQYFYYDGGENAGKIYAGPIWDFDHTMGTRKAWALTIPNSFYANRLNVKDGFDAPWFYYLYQKEEFYERMLEEYEMVFLPALELLRNVTIQTYAQQIECAASMDYVRWSVESHGMDAEVEEITGFLEQRIDFLNEVWLENAQYHMVKVDQGFGAFYGYFAVSPGEYLEPLPELEDLEYSTFKGWYYTQTNTPVDFNQPITEDVEIYAKWEDSSQKQVEQIAKLAPVGIIGFMGVALLIFDRNRAKNR